MVVVSSHDRALPPKLYPRPVAPERSPEQLREERRQAFRDAIHGNLHELYDKLEDSEYCGPITASRQAAEGHDSHGLAALGHVLTHGFTSHLEWYVFSNQEMPRDSKLGRALYALAKERPSLYAVVLAHLEADRTHQEIADLKHLDRKTVGERWRLALDILAGKLGAYRQPPSN